MIRWGEPTFLWLLLLVPVIAAIGLVAARLRRRRLENVVEPTLLPALVPDRLRGMALLKQGLSFLNIGEANNARLVLKELVAKHPDSSEAGIAKQKLESL